MPFKKVCLNGSFEGWDLTNVSNLRWEIVPFSRSGDWESSIAKLSTCSWNLVLVGSGGTKHAVTVERRYGSCYVRDVSRVSAGFDGMHQQTQLVTYTTFDWQPRQWPHDVADAVSCCRTDHKATRGVEYTLERRKCAGWEASEHGVTVMQARHDERRYQSLHRWRVEYKPEFTQSTEMKAAYR